MIAPTLLLPLLSVPLGDASSFAKSLALLGDLDGDRCSEIAVGSPSDGDQHRGKLFVFSGKTGAVLRELTGDTPDGAFGSDVATVGDLDGDKIPDFAVSAPFVRGEGVQGSVVVFSGKDGKPIRTLAPTPGERYFGTDLVALGDLNGDKKEELLVRCRVGAGPEEHERFVVITLSTGKRMFAVESPAGVTCHDLGRPLARVPDVDGDKVPDFAVEWASDVHVCSGKDGKVLRTLVAPIPPTEKSNFGFSICAFAGKFPVVAVGDTLDEKHGSIRLFTIEPAAEAGGAEKEGGGAALSGDEGFTGVGYSLAAAGDLNKDGVEDVAAGWTNGEIGGVLMLSGKDLASVRTIPDEAPKGQIPLGWRVAAGLDVDGDGTPDVAVSRYWPTAPAASARGVLVLSGADGHVLHALASPAPPPEKKKPAGK
jgi:FG-GAP repeat protein